MTRFSLCLTLLAALPLAACSSDLSTPPEHVLEQQQLDIRNRPAPSATEMPPGLGEDLPQPPSTQPASTNH